VQNFMKIGTLTFLFVKYRKKNNQRNENLKIWKDFMMKRFHQKYDLKTIFECSEMHVQGSPICMHLEGRN